MDIVALRGIKHIVAHKDPKQPCADGTASAIIAHRVLPDAKIQFVAYQSPELEAIEPAPGYLFVDIVPPKSRALQWVEHHPIVLDHHLQAEDVVAMFGENGVYADLNEMPGVSAALLTFIHVYLPLREERDKRIKNPSTLAMDNTARLGKFAELVGVRDTWQMNDSRWEEASEIAAALVFFPQYSWFKEDYEFAFDGPKWHDRMAMGKDLWQAHKTKVFHLFQVAHRMQLDCGLIAAVVPSSDTSDVANLLTDAHIVVGFDFLDRNGIVFMRLSMRSRPIIQPDGESPVDIDVSSIAAKMGGGGHRNAAGCTFPLTSDTPNPYATILSILNQFL